MNIAITVWGNRISPVFDASQTLLVVVVNDGQIIDQKSMLFHALHFDWVERVFREHEIEMLICGAICELGAERLRAMGVEVTPFLTGKVDKILSQFINGEEFVDFAMPGCRVGGCCRRRSEREINRKRNKKDKED